MVFNTMVNNAKKSSQPKKQRNM